MKTLLLLALLSAPLAADPAGIFRKGSEWKVVSEGHQFAEGMVVDAENNLYFTDVPRSQLWRVDGRTGKKTLLDEMTGRANGIARGPDSRIYGCAGGDRKIYAWTPGTWRKEAVASGPRSNDIAVRKDGTIFFTDPQNQCVWRVSAGAGTLEKAAKLEWRPNGITLSLDHKTLLVAEFASRHIHGFAIAEDNTLGKDTLAFQLRVPADGKGSLDGMMVHVDGRLLAGTNLGVQVATPLGKQKPPAPPIVIPIPNNLPRANYVRTSPDGRWLYVAHAKAILRRELDPTFSRNAAQDDR